MLAVNDKETLLLHKYWAKVMNREQEV